jgi:hypothetical protein
MATDWQDRLERIERNLERIERLRLDRLERAIEGLLEVSERQYRMIDHHNAMITRLGQQIEEVDRRVGQRIDALTEQVTLLTQAILRSFPQDGHPS